VSTPCLQLRGNHGHDGEAPPGKPAPLSHSSPCLPDGACLGGRGPEFKSRRPIRINGIPGHNRAPNREVERGCSIRLRPSRVRIDYSASRTCMPANVFGATYSAEAAGTALPQPRTQKHLAPPSKRDSPPIGYAGSEVVHRSSVPRPPASLWRALTLDLNDPPSAFAWVPAYVPERLVSREGGKCGQGSSRNVTPRHLQLQARCYRTTRTCALVAPR
jgi:hypothetical protein